MTNAIPTLPAYYGPAVLGRLDNRSRSLHVWCDYCIRWHTHGGPNAALTDISEAEGHRVAHCADIVDRRGRTIGRSPYDETGYYLTIVGPYTREVQAAARVKARELKMARKLREAVGRMSEQANREKRVAEHMRTAHQGEGRAQVQVEEVSTWKCAECGRVLRLEVNGKPIALKSELGRRYLKQLGAEAHPAVLE